MIKSNYKVIALMSGTSLDGIDLIYVSFSYGESWKFKIINSDTFSYSSKWKLILRQLVNTTIADLKVIDIDYSQYLSSVILSFIDKYNISDIDFIASHGHTALHQPENRLTLQIGNLQVLADALQQKVICDFRVQDVAYGGQGAPLVPIGDRLLFGAYDYCLNLGGFANISFQEHYNKRIAFDICPVNIVMNYYVSQLGLEYDDKGQIASEGNINEDLLNHLNELDFYKLNPPKSLGLEWVDNFVLPLIDTFKLSVASVLRTFVEHIAIQVSMVVSKPNTTLLITGGGVYNTFLVSRIKAHSQSRIIIPPKEIIEFKEALIFGLLGVLKERDEINCLRSVTGASKDHSSGKILLPNS